MEVLKKGKDVEWEQEIVCTHCKSKILVTADDVIMYKDPSCFLSHIEQYYVICHGHKLYLMVYDNLRAEYEGIVDIPKHVRSAAYNRYLKVEKEREKEEIKKRNDEWERERIEKDKELKQAVKIIILILLLIGIAMIYFGYFVPKPTT